MTESGKKTYGKAFTGIFTWKGKIFSQEGKFEVSKKKVVIIIRRYESQNRV